MVFGLCRRIIGNHRDAQEAAQDVFVKIYRQAQQFNGASHLKTWIYRIAVNTALNYLRRKRWEKPFSFFLSNSEDGHYQEFVVFAPQSDSPDEQLREKKRWHILNKALTELGDKQRTAFVLHKFDQLSYQQIADVMNTTLPAIESLMHRAKKQLQKHLIAALKEQSSTDETVRKFLALQRV